MPIFRMFDKIKIDKVYDRIGFPSNWKDIMNIERRLDNEAKE